MSKDIVVVHYGTKGMKWGVRKDRAGSSSGGGREEAFLKKVGKTPGKSSIKTISDEVLQKRVKRLNLEKQYIDLVAKEKVRNRTVMEKGARGVGKLLENTGKEILKSVISNKVIGELKRHGVMTPLADIKKQPIDWWGDKKL